MKPQRLAHLPTPIHPFDMGTRAKVYLKRDDLTGFALSGNKIRKLQYLLGHAKSLGMKDVFTCGALGSNHARATAWAAAQLGMRAHLLLAGEEKAPLEGNRLLDQLIGADIRYIDHGEYARHRMEIMGDWADAIGGGYLIGEGGSCGLGSLGYVDAFEEIRAQERQMGLRFDTIVLTVGSGGTYAGLAAGAALEGQGRTILGVSISHPARHFTNVAIPIILAELEGILKRSLEDVILDVRDGFQGLGYGKNTDEDLKELASIIRRTGILFDPVYTGKAIRALKALDEMEDLGNVLFIHTGGGFGWSAEAISRIHN